MSATKDLMGLDPTKSVVAWDRYNRFSHVGYEDMQDPTGIHIEEGEFLYGLVRMLKPLSILETGTNIGVSTQYMALALRDNGLPGATVRTIEHSGCVADKAKARMEYMGLSQWVKFNCCAVSQFFELEEGAPYNMAWLDTEFAQRYSELVWVFDHMIAGGIICIHDLWELDTKDYGGVPDVVRGWIRKGFLRALTFDTQHGVTVFQKRRDKDHLANIQAGLL